MATSDKINVVDEQPPSNSMAGSIKRKSFNASPFFLALAVTWTHIFLSPYTKVEESFTLHAVHDFLAYVHRPGLLSHWDHITFPGAVPRSFTPPLILAGATYPFASLLVWLGVIKSKLGIQVLVRLVLATLFSASFQHLSRSIAARYGKRTMWWFVIFSLSGFHIPYYAGRTIPNFLALPLVLLGISLIIRSTGSLPGEVKAVRVRKAIEVLTVVATIVRLEIALFLLPTVLSLVLQGHIPFTKALKGGMIGGLGALMIGSPFDIQMWSPTLHHPSFPFHRKYDILWPEMTGLIYNFFNDKASNWGVMRTDYYFTNSLPKLMAGTTIPFGIGGWIWTLSLLGVGKKGGQWGKWTRVTGRTIEEVAATFGPGVVGLVFGMSLIGHKEWRFIIYCVPILVLMASITAAALWQVPSPRLRPLVRLGLVGLVCANLAFTGISTFFSVHNYPGGEVWEALEALKISGSSDNLTIHFTSYPLQTGASLFTFIHDARPAWSPALPATEGPVWNYDKSEDPALATAEGADKAGVNWHVVVTDKWQEWDGRGWTVVKKIEGLAGVERKGKYRLGMRKEAKIGILVRA